MAARVDKIAKSATDVMQEVIYAAVIDSIVALKAASKGLPNTLLRDLNAVHGNTTFADLPKELQDSISASVRAAFTRLLREGYSVSSAQLQPPRPVSSQRDAPDHPQRDRVQRDRKPAPRRDGPDGRRPPRGGKGPGGKPKPRGA